MMGGRKRKHVEIDASEHADESNLLSTIRNTWEFANLMQYIYIFGRAVKIDESLDIEDLERECCKPEPSTVLSDIGLALLKYVSSHRGLTPEIFDEYTRRQYVAKSPTQNPFGVDEEPSKFVDFDIFTKLKVLVQLSVWTLNNAERIREKMEERGEQEQSVAWRINEIGYDREDRYYFILDDNRLYRRTELPPPPTHTSKPKAKTKRAKTMNRAAKRRRARETEMCNSTNDGESDLQGEKEETAAYKNEDGGLGGRRWECIAITLLDYEEFLQSIAKSRHPDERLLHKRITDDVLPVIEQAEAYSLRKKQKQEREMLNIQKLASAKRSSRIEAKLEKERHEREAYEAEQRRRSEVAEAEAYQRKQEKMDIDRESRMMTREQRLKEREMKRILHEQELARMSEEEKKADAGESRVSERQLRAEMEKTKKVLAALQNEDEWTFDCSKCGQHGANLDDGTHSVACERCNVWQHSACLGFSKQEVERNDFHFICHDCKRRQEDAMKPKIPSLKFRIGTSSSPPQQKAGSAVTFNAMGPDLPGKAQFNLIQPLPKGLQQEDSTRLSPGTMQGNYLSTVSNGDYPSGSNDLKRLSPQLPPKPTLNQAGIASENANFRTHLGPLPHTNGTSQPVTSKVWPPRQLFRPPSANNSSPQLHRRAQAEEQDTALHGQRSIPPVLQPSAEQLQQKQIGWSGFDVPPTTDTPIGPPPPDQNPFAQPIPNYQPRSLDDNRFSEVNGPNGIPATNATPSYQALQYSSPKSSSSRNPLTTPTTSNVNGFASNIDSINQPIGGPSLSPVKQASPSAFIPSPPRFPTPNSLTHQIALPPNNQLSPGFSPVKVQSPQQATSPGLGMAQNATVFTPMGKFAAGQEQQKTIVPDSQLQQPG